MLHRFLFFLKQSNFKDHLAAVLELSVGSKGTHQQIELTYSNCPHRDARFCLAQHWGSRKKKKTLWKKKEGKVGMVVFILGEVVEYFKGLQQFAL